MVGAMSSAIGYSPMQVIIWGCIHQMIGIRGEPLGGKHRSKTMSVQAKPHSTESEQKGHPQKATCCCCCCLKKALAYVSKTRYQACTISWFLVAFVRNWNDCLAFLAAGFQQQDSKSVLCVKLKPHNHCFQKIKRSVLPPRHRNSQKDSLRSRSEKMEASLSIS